MGAIESGVVTKRLPLRLQELEEKEEKLKAELDFAKASDFIITPEQIEFLLWQFVDPLDDESWEDYKRRIIKCFVQSVFLYETMSEEELDYSFLFSQAPKFSMDGRCMYCNHCLPCPQHINIAQVQKYLDMALLDGVSPTLQGHYDSLEQKAGDCIACGICETQCPFSVSIVERMQKAAALFER